MRAIRKILVILFVLTIIPISSARGDESGYTGNPVGISGGGSLLSESFQTDLATGAAAMSIPVTVPPGRKNMQPSVALSYSSNNSNGICGVGWGISQNFVQRSTKRGVPAYNDAEDIFIYCAGGANSELVHIGEEEYRARIEGAFMKYEFLNNAWMVTDKSGTKYIFGSTSGSRLQKGTNTYAWYLDRVEDVYGNYVSYTYNKPADGQIYPAKIEYTAAPDMAPDKTIEFQYESRQDKLHNYRSGWKITTSLRLASMEVRLNEERVWLYTLNYITSSDTSRSLLESLQVYDAEGNSLPPKRFEYQRLD